MSCWVTICAYNYYTWIVYIYIYIYMIMHVSGKPEHGLSFIDPPYVSPFHFCANNYQAIWNMKSWHVLFHKYVLIYLQYQVNKFMHWSLKECRLNFSEILQQTHAESWFATGGLMCQSRTPVLLNCSIGCRITQPKTYTCISVSNRYLV